MATTLEVIVKTAYSILVFGAVVGNLLVCITVLRHKALRTSINWLIMNLAVSDLMIVTAFTPRHILQGLYRHPVDYTGIILCKFVTSDTFTWIGTVASSVTLVIIAYERFAAVTAPLGKKPHFTGRKLKIAVMSCWIVAVVFSTPLFIVRKLNHERGFCESHWPTNKLAEIYNVAWLVLVGILPLCLMIYFYGKTISCLRQSRREILPRRHLSVLRSRKRITKMMMAITSIYGLCWIPNLVLYVVWYSFLEEDVMYDINEAFIFLILVNSFVNPLAYTAGSKRFRKHVKDVICCCKKQRNGQNGTPYFIRCSNATFSVPDAVLVKYNSTLMGNVKSLNHFLWPP